MVKKPAGRTKTRPKDSPMLAAPSSESQHVSIRKISNGYLLESSGCNAKGEYQSKTTFCKSKPKIVANPEKGSKA